jgi:hypothetical protein
MKKLIKKWYFWVIVGVIVLFAIIPVGNAEPTNSPPVSTEQTGVVVGDSEFEIEAIKLGFTSAQIDTVLKNIPNFSAEDYKNFKKSGNNGYCLTTKDNKEYYIVFYGEKAKYPGEIASIHELNDDYNGVYKFYQTKIDDNGKLIEIPYHKCDMSLTETLKATYLYPQKEIYTCSICKQTKTIKSGKKSAPVIFSLNSYSIDYLGGITLDVNIDNLTDKTVKYYRYQLSLYNAVGDKISSDLHNGNLDGSMCWEITGPVNPYESVHQNASSFYNNTFKGNYKLDWIQIEFTDGTVLTLNSSNYAEYEEIIK